MIAVEGDIGVQIADHLVVQVFDSLPPNVKRIHLGREMPLRANRQIDQHDPRMSGKKRPHPLRCPVRRAVIHNHPAQRKNRLPDHGLDRLLDEHLLVTGGSYEDVGREVAHYFTSTE